MVSDFVRDLCRAQETVTSKLAANQKEAAGSIVKELFDKRALPEPGTDETVHTTERAYECGQWGQTRPSELFLKIYGDILATLESNPLAGMVSPPLMGSNGVQPLCIIATVPEICRHMSNLIARAQQEVFLATNYWKHSEGSRLLCNALKELSKRALGENRHVVVKVMYDRGDAKQLITPHQSVPPQVYSDPNGPIRIPHPDDLPNVSLEVVNYHRPPLGTFHSKFMIVDREIAILQSNNIQDNDNLEMMTQFEGAIVDSIYDMALITWHNPLQPPLPRLACPAAKGTPPTFGKASYPLMFDEDRNLNQQYSFLSTRTGQAASPSEIAQHAYNRTDLPLHTSQNPHYDEDLSKEVIRAVAGFVPQDGAPLIRGVTQMLNVPAEGTEASAPDIEPSQMMTPIIPMPRHDPFPIAMVCREPYAPPTNASIQTPQNAAFLSALRNVTKTLFIQTPNLNAAGLLPEIIAACERGVHVTYYYCLGYNDAGELLPMQGGNNESVAHKLYKELKPEFRNNLDIYVYVAKDQVRPIHNQYKMRSCHIKLMIVDGHIGIQGSGNQDTQSWYHSQEVNVMIDSPLVCGKWMEGIKQNQNTHKYGKVETEGPDAGCWFDPQTGKQAEGAIGVSAGRFAWAQGIKGAIARLRGTGGF